VVHADLKPENILVKLNEDQTDIDSLKIIDFGTSFSLLEKKDSNISMATPEYMSPEMLEIISNSNKYTN
jgi:serine/threonine protein kinase